MGDEQAPIASQSRPRKIGAGKYMLGVAGIFVILFLALGAFSNAMNPTGSSGEATLAIPIVLIAFVTHIMLLIWRLRDANRSRWLTPVFVILPFVWIWISAELFGAQTYGWIPILIGALIIYAFPALFRTATTEIDA